DVARPTAKACLERLVVGGLLRRSAHKTATHDFSGPQVCIRLEGRGATNSVTGIWTNPPDSLAARAVSLFLDGRFVSTATATRSGRALTHTWPSGDLGSGTRVCVTFQGSARSACQTTG
ncbi:hypothetical protein AB0910_25705, partial [Streptomyces sp. NPDC047002]